MKITSEGGPERGKFTRALVTLLVLLAIVLVAVFFLVRTNGARSLIEERLSRRIGLETVIERSRIGFPYVLVLEGVKSTEYGKSGRAGFRASELRLGFIFPGRCKVRVRDCELVLIRKGSGASEPSVLSALGDLPWRNLAELSGLTESFRDRVVLDCSEVAIRWCDPGSKVLAEVGGLSFRMEPVRVPGRTMFYYHLRAYSVLNVDGTVGRAIEHEWLAGPSIDYMELYRITGDGEGGGGKFWNPSTAELRGVRRQWRRVSREAGEETGEGERR